MQASDLPSKLQEAFAKNAGVPYIRSIPVASQIGIVDGAASFNDGFPPLNFLDPSAGGVNVSGKDMNGILYAMSALLAWYSAGGPIIYDAAHQTAIGGYPAGAIVQSATVTGKLWVSTTENNITNPDTGGAGWTYQTNATNATNLTGSGTVSATTTGGAALTPTNAANATVSAVVTGSIISGTNPKFNVVAGYTLFTSGVVRTPVLNSEYYDVGSGFDSVTNYTFTPPINGYYHFSWGMPVYSSTGGLTAVESHILRDGTPIGYGSTHVYGSVYSYTTVGSTSIHLTTNQVITMKVTATGTGTLDTYLGYFVGELIP